MLKILHLYHDLMNLYGEWGNVDILARYSGICGCDVTVDKKSAGEAVDFDEYSFVYIGGGTERSQRACMKDLMRHKETLAGYIETGKHVLATGNSHELFGKTVTAAGGERYETLGLLDFETVQLNTRVTGDCICSCSLFTDELIGFINRAGGEQKAGDSFKKEMRPFKLLLGPRSEDGSNAEGIIYKNLLGTYLTGPVLVRNPPLLSYLAGKIKDTANETIGGSPLFSYQMSTYNDALAELKKRLE